MKYIWISLSIRSTISGVNASYLFGRIDDRLTLVLQPATSGYYMKTQTVTQMGSALFTLGAQLPFTIGKKHDFVIVQALILARHYMQIKLLFLTK